MTTRKTKLQQYLTTATDDDLQQLADYIHTAANRKLCLPCPERGWDFSYSAIAPELEHRGLLSRTHRSERITTFVQAEVPIPDSGLPPFVVEDICTGTEKVSRSVLLDQDVYDRIKALESGKKQYTHTAILNQLIKDGLAKYGY